MDAAVDWLAMARQSGRDRILIAAPQAGRVGPYVHADPTVPYRSRRKPRMFRSDPKPAPHGDPLVCRLCGRPGADAGGMVRNPSFHPVEKSCDEADRLADQTRNRRHTRGTRSRDAARPERIRPAAVPLQHRRVRLGSHTAANDRHADRPYRRRPCARQLNGKGGEVRQWPQWPRTERFLAELTRRRTVDDAVFLGRYRRPYTRFGVYHLVARSAGPVPSLEGRKTRPT